MYKYSWLTKLKNVNKINVVTKFLLQATSLNTNCKKNLLVKESCEELNFKCVDMNQH